MLLSVVIPTKGRTEYAVKTIEYIVSLKLQSLQIVVQDNNKTDELYNLLFEHIESGKVIYNHTRRPLSFVDNFEEAISHATGEYVTIIGDDDIINPEIIGVLRICLKNNIDSIVPSTNLFFLWPDSGVKNKVTQKGESFTFSIKPFSGRIKFIDNKNELQRLLKKGGVDYLSYNIPRLYHGIVKRSLLNKIKKKHGRLFEGLTPDIYIACMIASESQNSLRIDYPLTIPGACKSSGSVASDTGAHTGMLSEAPHFKFRGNYEWNNLVPKFYSVPTIWSDSAFAAARKVGYDKQIDNKLLFAKCFFEYKNYRAVFNELNPFNSYLDLYFYYYKYLLSGVFKKAKEKLLNFSNKSCGIYYVARLNELLDTFNSNNSNIQALKTLEVFFDEE